MNSILLPRPVNADAETLHAQIDALKLGPYCILWGDDELSFKFDADLSKKQQAALENVVSAHDGSVAIAEREAKAKRADELVAASEAAKQKRLSGQQLSQAELASLMDALLFAK